MEHKKRTGVRGEGRRGKEKREEEEEMEDKKTRREYGQVPIARSILDLVPNW